MIHVQCPRCKTRFKTSDANLGKTGQCPKCKQPLPVTPVQPQERPDPPGAEAPPRPAYGPAPPEHEPSPPAPAEPSSAPPDTALADAGPHPDVPPAGKTAPLPKGKSRKVALVLCIFTGVFGAHRFYLGSWGYGLVILALNLTCLGSLAFVITDVIRLATMDNDDFQDRYGECTVEPFTF